MADHISDESGDRKGRAVAVTEGRSSDVCQQLTIWLNALYGVGYWIEPFLPSASVAILDALREDPISKVEPIFPRAC